MAVALLTPGKPPALLPKNELLKPAAVWPAPMPSAVLSPGEVRSRWLFKSYCVVALTLVPLTASAEPAGLESFGRPSLS
jgi:hypothetical protein